jgi:hypothetical protein
MVSLPREAMEQFAAPPLEQRKSLVRGANFVGEIIGPATVGVHSAKMLTKVSWQKPADDGEVFVMR